MSKSKRVGEIQETDLKAVQVRRKQLEARLRTYNVKEGVRLPREVVRLVSATPGETFTHTDRKLMNLLQERVSVLVNSESKEDRDSARDFAEINISDVAKIIGTNDYSEIRKSLSRLRRLDISYNRLDENSRVFIGSTSFFSEETQDVDDQMADGAFRYAFPPGIMSLFRDPQPYAYVNLSNVLSFSSKYSVVLYEQLALYLHMKKRIWTVSVDDLLDIMGWPHVEGKPTDFGPFRAHGIDKAVKEINDLGGMSPFSVEVGYLVDPMDLRKRRIGEVRFTVIPNYDNSYRSKPKSEGENGVQESPVPEEMPDGYASVGILAKKPEMAKSYWEAFRRSVKVLPSDLKASWEIFVNGMAEKDQKNAGANVSNPKVWEMAKLYHKDIGLPHIGVTMSVLLAIWHHRRLTAELKSKVRGGAFGLDFKILKQGSLQGERDDFFKEVLEENSKDWSRMVPVRDAMAADRIWAMIERLSAPAAHDGSSEHHFSDDRNYDYVSPNAVSRAAAAEAERQKPTEGSVNALNEKVELLNMNFMNLDVNSADGYAAAMSAVAAVQAKMDEFAAQRRADINRKLDDGSIPFSGKVLESTDDDDVPF